MNTLSIRSIRCVGSQRLEYDYTVEGEWARCFNPAQPMWVEYSRPVAHVPDSVAVVPLIGNVIVLASLMDADIYVEEIDRDFLQCIGEFIDGFDTIMPDHVHFKRQGIVHARRIVDTPLAESGREENLLFFSGGVDATFSLISHLEEKPALVTVWGADIPWHNEVGWKHALGFNQEVADRYGLPLLSIRSNFRLSLNDEYLADYAMKLVNRWWWPAFHCSISMMCLAAPLACGKRARLYYASSYSRDELSRMDCYPIASHPLIDNHVRFCGCQVVHDGYAANRFEKIRQICNFYASQSRKTTLRVCYLSAAGRNCCVCEKCSRAIMSILLVGADPREYGFPYDEKRFPTFFAAGIQEAGRSSHYFLQTNYTDIQQAMCRQYALEQVAPELRIFYRADLAELADFVDVPNNELDEAVHSAQRCQARMQQQLDDLRREAEEARQSAQASLHAASSDLAHIHAAVQALTEEKRALEERIHAMEQSTSWKMTRPVRLLGRITRRIKAHASGR